MFAEEDRQAPAKNEVSFGIHFCTCIFYDVIYTLGKCTSHSIFLSFYCILQCNALLVFLPLEHIAWQQEEAPCGGPFMSEAIIFERTSAQPPAKHKHLTIERNMRKRLKHSAVHGSVSALFL